MRSTRARTAAREDRGRGMTMLLTMVLGITIGALGLVLLRQFLDGAFEERAKPVLTPSTFPRLAPPTRVRSPYRPSTPARRAA